MSKSARALDLARMSASTRRLNPSLFRDEDGQDGRLVSAAFAAAVNGDRQKPPSQTPRPRLRQGKTPEERLNQLERAFLRFLVAKHAKHNPAARPLVTLQEWATSFIIQPFKLPLATGLGYTPDFLEIARRYGSRTELILTAYEVKGPWFPSRNRAALKMAARTHQWINFVLVTAAEGDTKRATLSPENRDHWMFEKVAP